MTSTGNASLPSHDRSAHTLPASTAETLSKTTTYGQLSCMPSMGTSMGFQMRAADCAATQASRMTPAMGLIARRDGATTAAASAASVAASETVSQPIAPSEYTPPASWAASASEVAASAASGSESPPSSLPCAASVPERRRAASATVSLPGEAASSDASAPDKAGAGLPVPFRQSDELPHAGFGPAQRDELEREEAGPRPRERDRSATRGPGRSDRP